MQDTIFLICNRGGILSMRKTAPALRKGEIAVKIKVRVPSQVFDDYIPSFELEVTEAVVQRPPISIEMEEPVEDTEGEELEV